MSKQLEVSIGQYSSPGRKSVNQDFHGAFIPKEPQLGTKGIAIAIADGISTSDVSQVASETAVKGFLEDYYYTSDSWSVKTAALHVLKAINAWLYAQTRNSPHRYNTDRGYICTFSAIVLKSNTAHLFHSGDSRVFRLSGQKLEQLTNDHCRFVSAETSYLTRALGIHDWAEIDYQELPLSEGDVFVLATDGVYQYLPEKTFIDTIHKGENSLEEIAKNFVNEAYTLGSEDNLTLQIVKVNSLPEKNLHEIHQQVESLPPPPAISARMQFDGYTIEREIYISSRSHVYLAEDRETRERVVLKLPSTEMRNNLMYLESCLMEDWIAKRVDSAHVLKSVKSARKRNYLYTVSEFIEGQTLTQWMIDNPSPGVETVRAIVEQIAKGLQAFHRQEMVHQDLRPNNIMIDNSGTVKIIDFGSTKVAGVSEIMRNIDGIPGTAQYTAPEYFLGEMGTSKSDIFSLGVIAYQMLSGRLPYGTAVSKVNNARAQGRLSYNSLISADNNTPSWVDYALSKAVHIRPQKRYDEVSEFVYELRHPNPQFQSKARPPLIERNPVQFWQCVCLILLGVLLFQNLK